MRTGRNESARPWRVLRRVGFWLPAVAAALAVAAPARAATTTVTFDPPTYSSGQTLSGAPGVSFPDSPTVFTPSGPTQSPPNALRHPQACFDAQCSNGAHRLRFAFIDGVSQVSLRTGSDEGTTQHCFPEGTTCPRWARLIGYSAAGAAIADSRDVLIGEFGNSPITTLMSISDPAARIRSATLFVGKETFSHSPGQDNPGRAQIDDLSFTVPDSPPPDPPATNPPRIVLSQPVPGQRFGYPYDVRLAGRVEAEAGVFAFCTRINDASIPPPSLCTEGGRLDAANNFAVPISPDALRPGRNTLHAFAYDLEGRVASVSVEMELGTPPPPTIEISHPLAGARYDSVSDVKATGQVTAPGGLAGFCTRANATAAPAASQCTETGAVSFGGYFIAHPVRQGLRAGLNTIEAFAYDRFGQVGRASVPNVLLPSDPRVTAMEVTQGIQRADIPVNTGGPKSYSGAKLVWRGRTVVRVFANQAAGGGIPGVRVFLRGYYFQRPGDLRALGLLFPDSGPLDLRPGNLEVTAAERADPKAGFTFTLPADWTDKSSIILEAEVNPANSSPSVPESAADRANNKMRLENVRFTGQQRIVVSPVRLTWRNAAGTEQAPSADPGAVFARVGDVSPVAEDGLVVLPYAGTIDVSDVAAQSTLQQRAFERVAAFETRNLPGYTIGIIRGKDIGLEAPVVYAGVPFSNTPPRVEPIAVAGQDRPLTSVGHEFYHQLGYYHAGLSCNSAWPSISWPPDQRGLIQAIGLDRRLGTDTRPTGPNPGSGRYRIVASGGPSQPGQWFDLMSYCASTNETDAWISLRNWDAFGGALPNGVVPDDTPVLGVGDSTATITTALRTPRAHTVARAAQSPVPTLRVLASVTGDAGARILRVGPGTGRRTVTGARSPYRVVVRDAARAVISEAPLAGVERHVHGRAPLQILMLSAEVPATGAAQIEIVRDGAVLASRARSARAPSVSVLNPRAGQRVSGRRPVAVRWRSRDADGDPLDATVEYSGNGGRSYRVVTAGVTGDHVTLPGRLFSASRRARVRVAVNDGFNETEAVSRAFRAEGAPPYVRLAAPVRGARVRADGALRLVGDAFSDGGDRLAGHALRWFEGRRLLGRGRILDVSLTRPGTHRLRLVAVDGLGRRASRAVRVSVLGVRPFLLGLRVPRRIRARDRVVHLRAGASVPATLSVLRQRFRLGRAVRPLRVRIKPGRSRLVLRMRLSGGGGATPITVRIARR